ncbi:MAG: histidinol-phosphate transaminase [Fusicatenibacter sp.]|nr:histidinol-phosphate transaminase [Lachnospiraceae bacterium]MDY2936833.1 histidinol-phosphate transaminase [Fusicatenibacter sp.]
MDYEALMKESLLAMPAYKLPPQLSDVMKKYHLDTIEKMAANENQYGVSEKVVQAVTEEMSMIFRYPGDRNPELFEKISEKYQIPTNSIVLTVGATEAINRIGDIFLKPGDEVVMSSIPYMQYPMMVMKNAAVSVKVPVKEDLHQDLDGMLRAIGEKTKLVMICNPGNPTGVAEKSADLEAFIKAVPENVLIMIDEAYLDFASTEGCTESMMKLIPEKKNLMVVKTFSKIFAMAGMRVGFLAACPELLAALGRGGTVSGVSRVGVAACIAALEDKEHIKGAFEFNQTGRTYLMKELEKAGCKVYHSDTNFIYFDTYRDVMDLYELLLQHGILIRNFALNRVSVGTKEQNEKFICIVREFMSSTPALRAS